MSYLHRFRIDSKKFDEITKNTKYCSYCGHSIVFKVQTKKTICSHCGNWVYSNKEDEFKDKLLEKKKRLENEKNKENIKNKQK